MCSVRTPNEAIDRVVRPPFPLSPLIRWLTTQTALIFLAQPPSRLNCSGRDRTNYVRIGFQTATLKEVSNAYACLCHISVHRRVREHRL